MNLDKKDVRKIMLIIAFAILLYVGVQHMDIVFGFLSWLAGPLTPFIIGVCLAFYLNIPMKAIERRLFRPQKGKPVGAMREKARRPLAVAGALIIIGGIVVLLLFIVIPQLIESLTKLSNSIPSAVQSIQNWLSDLASEHEWLKSYIDGLEIDWNAITNTLTSFITNDVVNFVGSTFSIISTVIGTVVNVFLGILLSIYMLMKKEYLIERTKRLMYAFLPAKISSSVISVASITNKTFYNCIKGQMVECVILSSLTLFGLSILQFPYALLITACVAILSWVPMFGITIAIVIGAVFVFTANPAQVIWFVIFMVCLQQFEGNVIYPRVVGSTIGLPSIFVVSAIVIFGNFFGFFGLLVGVPITCVIYTILRDVVYLRLKKRKITKDKYECRPFDYELEKERRRIHKEHARSQQTTQTETKKIKLYKFKKSDYSPTKDTDGEK